MPNGPVHLVLVPLVDHLKSGDNARSRDPSEALVRCNNYVSDELNRKRLWRALKASGVDPHKSFPWILDLINRKTWIHLESLPCESVRPSRIQAAISSRNKFHPHLLHINGVPLKSTTEPFWLIEGDRLTILPGFNHHTFYAREPLTLQVQALELDRNFPPAHETTLAGLGDLQVHIQQPVDANSMNICIVKSKVNALQYKRDPVSKRPKVDIGSTTQCGGTTTSTIQEKTIDKVHDKNTDESFHLTLDVYIVPRGIDLGGRKQVDFFRDKLRKQGVQVLHTLDKNAIRSTERPTFLVVDSTAQIDGILEELPFDNLEELSYWLDEAKHVQWAKLEWLRRPQLLYPLRPEDVWHGVLRKKRPSRIACRKETKDAHCSSFDKKVPRNETLSELFLTLSKAIQNCPLNEEDSWRAFGFRRVSSILKHMDYEVSVETVDRLKAIKNLGKSSLDVIHEFLSNRRNTCTRLQHIENDPDRVRIKHMMQIWGVGPSTSRILALEKGLSDISAVRKSLQSGNLRLDRNQCLGVHYYEDFSERMSRLEVETIAARVTNVILESFPEAEINIMGSYRRGKLTCGDIDVLIVHPQYTEKIPLDGLGKIVDQLADIQVLASHLTKVAGMNLNKYDNASSIIGQQDAREPPSWYGGGKGKRRPDKDSCASYMGIANSPFEKRNDGTPKGRRIDIKWYPYKERIFASLYFTGDSFFNRAMRFRTKQKGWSLDDHGLWFGGSKTYRILDNPSHERDVFDQLELEWKEPSQRDGFAAVTDKNGSLVDLHVNQRILYNDIKVHDPIHMFDDV